MLKMLSDEFNNVIQTFKRVLIYAAWASYGMSWGWNEWWHISTGKLTQDPNRCILGIVGKTTCGECSAISALPEFENLIYWETPMKKRHSRFHIPISIPITISNIELTHHRYPWRLASGSVSMAQTCWWSPGSGPWSPSSSNAQK